jgi:hypothetical protein
MRRLLVGIAILLLGLGSTLSASAGTVPGQTSDSDFDGVRVHFNGFIEYSLDPLPEMTPPGFSLSRPVEKTAFAFLRANLSLLGIQQEPQDFRILEVRTDAPGSRVVVLQQTHLGYEVDSSSIELTVTGQVVTHVGARFISDVSALPFCTPSDGLRAIGESWARAMGYGNPSEATMDKVFYRPYGGQTYFGMLESMDVSSGQLILVVNVCTGEILDGYTDERAQ